MEVVPKLTRGLFKGAAVVEPVSTSWWKGQERPTRDIAVSYWMVLYSHVVYWINSSFNIFTGCVRVIFEYFLAISPRKLLSAWLGTDIKHGLLTFMDKSKGYINSCPLSLGEIICCCLLIKWIVSRIFKKKSTKYDSVQIHNNSSTSIEVQVTNQIINHAQNLEGEVGLDKPKDGTNWLMPTRYYFPPLDFTMDRSLIWSSMNYHIHGKIFDIQGIIDTMYHSLTLGNAKMNAKILSRLEKEAVNLRSVRHFKKFILEVELPIEQFNQRCQEAIEKILHKSKEVSSEEDLRSYLKLLSESHYLTFKPTLELFNTLINYGPLFTLRRKEEFIAIIEDPSQNHDINEVAAYLLANLLLKDYVIEKNGNTLLQDGGGTTEDEDNKELESESDIDTERATTAKIKHLDSHFELPCTKLNLEFDKETEMEAVIDTNMKECVISRNLVNQLDVENDMPTEEVDSFDRQSRDIQGRYVKLSFSIKELGNLEVYEQEFRVIEDKDSLILGSEFLRKQELSIRQLENNIKHELEFEVHKKEDYG